MSIKFPTSSKDHYSVNANGATTLRSQSKVGWLQGGEGYVHMRGTSAVLSLEMKLRM